jgi:hypothetical protein
MTAYREIIDDKQDLERVFALLKSLGQKCEIIILPIEEDAGTEDFIKAQQKSMQTTWENEKDKAWDDL